MAKIEGQAGYDQYIADAGPTTATSAGAATSNVSPLAEAPKAPAAVGAVASSGGGPAATGGDSAPAATHDAYYAPAASTGDEANLAKNPPSYAGGGLGGANAGEAIGQIMNRRFAATGGQNDRSPDAQAHYQAAIDEYRANPQPWADLSMADITKMHEQTQADQPRIQAEYAAGRTGGKSFQPSYDTSVRATK